MSCKRRSLIQRVTLGFSGVFFLGTSGLLWAEVEELKGEALDDSFVEGISIELLANDAKFDEDDQKVRDANTEVLKDAYNSQVAQQLEQQNQQTEDALATLAKLAEENPNLPITELDSGLLGVLDTLDTQNALIQDNNEVILKIQAPGLDLPYNVESPLLKINESPFGPEVVFQVPNQ